MLEIKYHSSSKGKKFYRVLRSNGHSIFLGTLGECRRFSKVHLEKVRKHFAKSLDLPREIDDLIG